MPFQIELESKGTIESWGGSRQIASTNNKDTVWFLLITNAELRYFKPPELFSSMSNDAEIDDGCFTRIPWLIFRPEILPGLRHHQEETLKVYKQLENSREVHGKSMATLLLEKMTKLSHEVHVVNYEHLSSFLKLADNPPRIGRISPKQI